MKIYDYHGVSDFIICAGHLGYVVKEYFANYFLHMSDITFELLEIAIQVHKKEQSSGSLLLLMQDWIQ